MKTNLRFIAAAVLITIACHLQAQQTIHSTTNGGLWPVNDTWIEAIPTDNDSVVLQGPISMLSYSGWCKSLNITSVASLGGNGGQGNLFISGSLLNNGNISGSINYNLKGNLVNNIPWTGFDNHIYFTGMDHSISCAAGAGINAQLHTSDSLQNFTLGSDVKLNTTFSSDLGFSQLSAGKHKLNIASGGFANCRLQSLDSLLFDAWVLNVSLTGNYKIKGNMICYQNIVFYDQVTNYGNIQFASGIAGDPLKLKCDFMNYGTLSHSWVQVEKNIINNGIWESENTEFIGTGDKHISQSAGHPFGGTQFSSDNSGSMIFLDTDIKLTVPAFHLNNNTLNCGDHILEANTTFYDGTIISDAEISGNNDFWNSTIKGNVILSGNNQFSNSTMDGVIDNTGILKDVQFYGGYFKSYNHLINHNSIQSLNLKVYGNLTNLGTIDNNSVVEITGNVPQYINLTQSIESSTRFISDVSGTSYQWTKDGSDLQNQTSEQIIFNSLQPSDAGVYKCRVVTGSAETIYSREIIVNNITSVAENKMITGFQVFPNPVIDHTNMKWNQKSTAYVKIDLLDVNGTQIRNIVNSVFPSGKNEIEFNMDYKIEPGIYFIRLIENGRAQARKLIYTK